MIVSSTRSSLAALLIEGMTPDELLALSDRELDTLVFCDRPIVFSAGTAEILGQFSIAAPRLVVELAQIDGGGEGVLPTLATLAHRVALQRGLGEVEWIVHAINCANPNLKLRRVMEKRGFKVELVKGSEAYHRIEPVRRVDA